MADLLTFQPLYPDQDEETILERWRGWANEGREPTEEPDQWTDTREGQLWWIHTTPGRREAARLYDLMGTEVVAATFPQTAWGEYLDDHAEVRDLARKPATPADGEVTFTGTPGTVIPAGTTVGVEPADPDAEAPEYETAETVTIPAGPDPNTVTVGVVARETGSASNVGPGAVVALSAAPPGVLSVTNEEEIRGGTDTETDTALKARILESFVGAAVANQVYYRRIALEEPGVGRATVIPTGLGIGTVLIIVSTADGDPVAQAVVDSLQARLDPIPAQGAGEGQVGAAITVATSSTLAVDVAAIVEFETGYAMDGGGGMIPMREAILAAIAAYIDSVQSGEEVVLVQVMSRIARLTGVHDVGGVTLNGVAANITVPATPSTGGPLVPTLGSTSGIVEGAL